MSRLHVSTEDMDVRSFLYYSDCVERDVRKENDARRRAEEAANRRRGRKTS